MSPNVTTVQSALRRDGLEELRHSKNSSVQILTAKVTGASEGGVPPSRPAGSHHTGRCTGQSCHWKGGTGKPALLNALARNTRILQASNFKAVALLSTEATLNNPPHSVWGLMLHNTWWAVSLGGFPLQFFQPE